MNDATDVFNEIVYYAQKYSFMLNREHWKIEQQSLLLTDWHMMVGIRNHLVMKLNISLKDQLTTCLLLTLKLNSQFKMHLSLSCCCKNKEPTHSIALIAVKVSFRI